MQQKKGLPLPSSRARRNAVGGVHTKSAQKNAAARATARCATSGARSGLTAATGVRHLAANSASVQVGPEHLSIFEDLQGVHKILFFFPRILIFIFLNFKLKAL